MNYALLGFVIGCLLTWLVMVKAQNRAVKRLRNEFEVYSEADCKEQKRLALALVEAKHRLAAFERTRGPKGQFVRKGEH